MEKLEDEKDQHNVGFLLLSVEMGTEQNKTGICSYNLFIYL